MVLLLWTSMDHNRLDVNGASLFVVDGPTVGSPVLPMAQYGKQIGSNAPIATGRHAGHLVHVGLYHHMASLHHY